MQLMFLEGTHYFGFSYCLCTGNGTWASRVMLSTAFFDMGMQHRSHVLLGGLSQWLEGPSRVAGRDFGVLKQGGTERESICSYMGMSEAAGRGARRRHKLLPRSLRDMK